MNIGKLSRSRERRTSWATFTRTRQQINAMRRCMSDPRFRSIQVLSGYSMSAFEPELHEGRDIRRLCVRHIELEVDSILNDRFSKHSHVHILQKLSRRLTLSTRNARERGNKFFWWHVRYSRDALGKARGQIVLACRVGRATRQLPPYRR